MSAADCPICLHPLPSSPWGVVAPCGHPFHRECWEGFARSHRDGGGGRGGRKKKLPPCAICKGAAKSFVPVFVDLGGEGDEECAVLTTRAKGGEGGVIDVDGEEEDELEKIEAEWDELWKELEVLCRGEEDRGEDGGEDGERSPNDDDVVEISDGSDRLFADLCAAIDLTQDAPSPPPRPAARSEDAPERAAVERRRQDRIDRILGRLKVLREDLAERALPKAAHLSSSSSSAVHRRLRRLASKIRDLRTSNAELASIRTSLEGANESLASRAEELRRTASERTLEAERLRCQHETLRSDHESMESSYLRFRSKSSVETDALRAEVTKLREERAKLERRNGSEDAKEMQEVRKRYAKVVQELHDAKSERARATEERKRERGRWKREREGRTERFEREREAWRVEREGLRERMRRLLAGGGGEGGPGRDCGAEAGANELDDDDGGDVADLKRSASSTTDGDGRVRPRGSGRQSNEVGDGRRSAAGSDAADAGRAGAGEGDRGRIGGAAGASSGAGVPPLSHNRSVPSRSVAGGTATAAQILPAPSRGRFGGARPEARTATEALDGATARKLSMRLHRSREGRERRRRSPARLRGSGAVASGDRSDRDRRDDASDGVRLMMRTTGGKKRRRGNPSGQGNVQDDEDVASGSAGGSSKEDNGRGHAVRAPKRAAWASAAAESPLEPKLSYGKSSPRKRNGVTASARQRKGDISSFFRPVG